MRIGAGLLGLSAGSAQGFGDNPRISRGTAPLFTPGDGAFHLESYTHTSHAPARRTATGKGASKVRRCARHLRRTAHLPGAPPPPPVPLSPPDARATLVPRRAATLSSHKRARCRVRSGAPYGPHWEERRTLRAPSSACYAPSSVDLRAGSAQLMCILTPASSASSYAGTPRPPTKAEGGPLMDCHPGTQWPPRRRHGRPRRGGRRAPACYTATGSRRRGHGAPRRR